MATVHLPPPEVRVTYWGFDLAGGHGLADGPRRRDGGRRTKGVKGADDAAVCGKVVLLEGRLLEAVHGGARRGRLARRRVERRRSAKRKVGGVWQLYLGPVLGIKRGHAPKREGAGHGAAEGEANV